MKKRTSFVVLLTLAMLTIVGIKAADHPTASITVDCVGKPYATTGCPIFSSSSSSAVSHPFCGNGVMDSGEECDNGRFNGVSNCTDTCGLLFCGDGVISPQITEECEPDSQEVYAIDPDSGLLTTTVQYMQASCGTICTVPTCDSKGNCSGGCKRKFLPACTDASMTDTTHAAASSAPTSHASVATAATIIPSSAAPAAAPGTTAAPIVPRCGDDILQNGEQCDDGAGNSNLPGSRCRIDCTLARCGDGVMDPSRGEQCDDLTNNSDLPNAHCRSSCMIPKCGDGIIDTARGEQCDDGPNNANAPGAHCRLDCSISRCGDGVVDPAEECDAGAGNSDQPGAKCSKSCALAKCGDGIVQAGEQCDDGPGNANTPNTHCRKDCRQPMCGDGVIDSARGEQCDDGSKDSDTRPNACRTNCSAPRCGDGVVDAGEQCDDGSKNGSDIDQCTVDCRIVIGKLAAASGGIPMDMPIAIIVGSFAAIGTAVYVIRRTMKRSGSGKSTVKKSSGTDAAKVLNEEIPLDELEMPWHKWE